jgi:hypothetical protein
MSDFSPLTAASRKSDFLLHLKNRQAWSISASGPLRICPLWQMMSADGGTAKVVFQAREVCF